MNWRRPWKSICYNKTECKKSFMCSKSTLLTRRYVLYLARVMFLHEHKIWISSVPVGRFKYISDISKGHSTHFVLWRIRSQTGWQSVTKFMSWSSVKFVVFEYAQHLLIFINFIFYCGWTRHDWETAPEHHECFRSRRGEKAATQ